MYGKDQLDTVFIKAVLIPKCIITAILFHTGRYKYTKKILHQTREGDSHSLFRDGTGFCPHAIMIVLVCGKQKY